MLIHATYVYYIVGIVLAVIIICIIFDRSNLVDRIICRTIIDPPYETTAEIIKFHNTLTVVDLHADTLLWKRDLLHRASRGHVDLPRLIEGNVSMQVFGVVTGVPFPLRMDNNRDGYDITGLLANWQEWPSETHDSRFQRALYQARKLDNRVKASNGVLKMITSRRDLEAMLEARERGEKVIGAMLSLEGTHALEGNIDNFGQLFDAGFRIIGLVHLFDNDMAGSSHGRQKYGLTAKGRKLIQRLIDHMSIIDLAHASPETITDVLAMVDRPVIASHGGVRGTCDSVRNLSDEHIRGIAATGGVIGIGLYEYATCGKTLEDTVRAMRYVTDLVGVEHVALGSDFDGSAAIINVSGLPMLTDAMLKADFTEKETVAIMGDNALRVFRQTLPDQ